MSLKNLPCRAGATLSLQQPRSPACCLCFQKKPFHAGAGWIAEIPLVLRSLVCFILQKHLWEGIRQSQRKTQVGRLMPGTFSITFSPLHHPFSLPSSRTLPTGVIFSPIRVASLANPSREQWCALSRLFQELVTGAGLGSARRGSGQ